MSKMPEPIEAIRALSREYDLEDERRAHLAAQLKECSAKLAVLEQRIKDAATALVGKSSSVTSVVPVVREAPKEVQPVVPTAAELPPRYMKLLSLVDGKRDLATLAPMVYGQRDDTEQARASVSSDLSRMKAMGLVESVHRGVSRRTAAGDRIVGGHRKVS